VDALYAIFIFPLEYLMGLCLGVAYRATSSYGVSVVILSIAVNVVLLPLYYLAEKWKLDEKNKRRRMEWELSSIRTHSSRREKHYYTQEVYRRFDYHPISAVKVSLGFLIQIPFFLSAYHLLSHFGAWRGQGFLVLDDLSAPDGLMEIAGFSFNLLPIAMTVINLASAYIYTVQMDRSEKVQLWALALLFMVVLYKSPSGLVLYWTCNNLFSLAKNMVGQRLNLDFLASHQARAPLSAIAGDSTGYARLVKYREAMIRRLDLPLSAKATILVAAFLALMALAGIENRASGLAQALFGLSVTFLAYLCIVPLLKTFRGQDQSRQERARNVVVRALLLVLVVVTLAWLFGQHSLAESSYMKRGVLGILLVLVALLFAPSVLGRIPILRRMPDRPGLYAVAASTAIFLLCVANPLSLYASSEDFSGGAIGVAEALSLQFLFAALFASAMYLLVDRTSRNALTLLAVFLSVCVVVYSSLLNVGLMDHFILNDPEQLSRSAIDHLAESAGLAVLVLVTAYAADRHRRLTIYAIGAVLATSMVTAVAAVYKGRDNGSEPPTDLPRDNDLIIGFSRESNVLIVMLDGFPGAYVQRIQQEAPDALKEYDGFVWYPNTLTTNTATWGSIAALAGGPDYTVEAINNRDEPSLGQAIREAYSVYPDAFIPEGYDVTYVNPGYPKSCHDIDPRVHCALSEPYGAHYHATQSATPLARDSVGVNVPAMMVMVSLFRAAPMFLKSWIYDGGEWHGANSNRSAQSYWYKAPEWGFLSLLAGESTAESPSKTFKFIALSMPHWPYALNGDCMLQPTTATFTAETVCSLRELGVLFARLKRYGIYDNTRIVLVSDHGWWTDNPMFPTDFSATVPVGFERRTSAGFVQPLLMVKDFGARGEMRRSDAFMSNSDVPSIVCSGIASCRGVGPTSIDASQGDRVLTVNTTAKPPDWDKTSKFDVKERYRVKGNIFDAKNWTKVE
jgi:YidC/Oxa1 family membrane protein insertase